MSKAKKTVIVEYLYTGLFEFSDRGKWIKWRAYRDLKTAENVAELLNRKFSKSFQFRVQPPNTVCTGQERVTSPEAALSTPAHSPAQEGEQ